MSAGLRGSSHDLELGEVRAVILAVPQLHEAFRGDGVVSAGRRGIQADTLQGQFIDLTGAVPEVRLQGIPIVQFLEATQEDAQTIIGELGRAKGLAQQVAQRMMETLSPLLNMDLGVVTPGEDEGNPASGQGAVR